MKIPKVATDVFTPRPDEHIFIVGFSGGKDSLAVLLYLLFEIQAKRVIAVFADTNHEAKETYDYVEMLKNEFGMPITTVTATLGEFADEKELAIVNILIRLKLIPESEIEILGNHLILAKEAKSNEDKKLAIHHLGEIETRISEIEKSIDWRDEPLTMERLAVLKRRFPSSMVRFCTTFLKLMPQRSWLSRYVKTLDAADVSRIVRVSGVRAQESKKRASHPTARFDDYMNCWLWLPIHKWTHEDVFAIAEKHGIPVNPLYKMGCGRVGCYPCINASKQELRAIAIVLINLRAMRIAHSISDKG